MSDQDLIRDDIEGYLKRHEEKTLLRFVIVGSVDDGKSTLIGRLLYDTNMVYDDQLSAARKASNMEDGSLDLSLLTDGLAAEREQGITIDVAYRYFTTEKRKFIVADTPGHLQYTRNMVTGASTADVGIILIDARLGVLEQSRRHAYIDDIETREDAGTPAILGKIRAALAFRVKEALGTAALTEREHELFGRALARHDPVPLKDPALAECLAYHS